MAKFITKKSKRKKKMNWKNININKNMIKADTGRAIS